MNTKYEIRSGELVIVFTILISCARMGIEDKICIKEKHSQIESVLLFCIKLTDNKGRANTVNRRG